METEKSFGAWLRQQRRRLDLTQNELAQRAGYSVATIRKLERDELRPSKQLSERLAHCLEVATAHHSTLVAFARSGARPLAPPTPLPSAQPTQHNLPRQLTPFIGRDSALIELARQLTDPTCRLLTLVGPGGMGKTRLAIEVAQTLLQHFAHGVSFVALAPLRTSEHIVLAMVEALNFPFQADSRSPKAQLCDFLRHKHLLLVLDNFEHLHEGVYLLQELLQSCPDLRLLVTSRERLHLSSETVYTVGGLDFPPETAALSAQDYSAVALFVETARRIQPKFSLNPTNEQAISQICRLVSGIPLAILLAATWVKILSPAEIVTELRQGFDVLEAELLDLPDRQRSMRTVLAQSWQRLSEAERTVMRHLAVFRGGFTRQAAQSVAGASLRILSSLVNKSFVQYEPSGRYALHELLRQYAETELAQAGQTTDVHTVHCRYYMNLLQQREPDIKSCRQVAALDEIEADFANVSAAWQWAVTHKDYVAVGEGLEALHLFSSIRRRLQEGQELLRFAREQLAPTPDEEPHSIWGRVVARMFMRDGLSPEPLTESNARFETALVIARRDANRAEIAFCLFTLGAVLAISGDARTAIAYCEESRIYYQALAERFYQGFLLRNLGLLYMTLNQPEQCNALIRQSLEVKRKTGDTDGLTMSLDTMGWISYNCGQYTAAATYWQEAYQLRFMAGYGLDDSYFGSAWLALFNDGDLARVRTLAVEIERISADIGDPGSKDRAMIITGLLAGIDEEYHACRHLFQQRDLIYFNNLPMVLAWGQLGFCLAACGLADLPAARRHLHSILQISLRHQWPANTTKGLTFAAIIAAKSGRAERAAELLGLVFHHSLSPKGWLTQWPLLTRLQAELEVILTLAVFTAAWTRGKSFDLMATAESQLAELTVEKQNTLNTLVIVD